MWSPENFWSKVDFSGDCWTWQGAKQDGYGIWALPQAPRPGKRRVFAHRFAFQCLAGPLTADQVLDHLCGNRACINPTHLEPVTNAENSRRASSHKRTWQVELTLQEDSARLSI